MIRTLVRKYLSKLGLQIIEAADGQAGLEAARAENPDLIILDVNMPIMDGPGLLRELRDETSTKHFKVLMLTAESSEKLVIELIKLGISDFIVKPFEEDLLIKKVARILQFNPEDVLRNFEAPLKKVLVVDDNESVLVVARKFLAGVADVVTTTHPEKALHLASEHSPDVVFLDLQTDAVSVLNDLRQEGVLASSKFVCLTTKSNAGELADPQAIGFSEVLFKPFDKESLTRSVQGAGLSNL
jgi:CheY-like chemotaxis protein